MAPAASRASRASLWVAALASCAVLLLIHACARARRTEATALEQGADPAARMAADYRAYLEQEVLHASRRRPPRDAGSRRGARAAQSVHYVRRVAAVLPAPAARMQALASEELEPAGEAPSDDVSPAEDARCIGLLHACQTWLQLRDGQNNSIVITSPTDDATELINKDVVLPASGAAIPASTWGLLQDACKYGLADLSTCSKPRHWPRCSGLACGGQGAHEFRQPGPGGADAAGAKH